MEYTLQPSACCCSIGLPLNGVYRGDGLLSDGTYKEAGLLRMESTYTVMHPWMYYCIWMEFDEKMGTLGGIKIETKIMSNCNTVDMVIVYF
jgi:hypothetical protein